MTDAPDLSAAQSAMATPAADKSAAEAGSRAEAVLAEVHHHSGSPRSSERSEELHGVVHHHPADPNAGVVRVPLSRATIVAGLLTAAVSIAAVVLLALAIGGNG